MPRRKALLIGINYFGTKHQLNGCINDAMNMKDYLVRDRGYSASHHDMVSPLESLPRTICNLTCDAGRDDRFTTKPRHAIRANWSQHDGGSFPAAHYSRYEMLTGMIEKGFSVARYWKQSRRFRLPVLFWSWR